MCLLHTFKRSRASFPDQNQLVILRGKLFFLFQAQAKNWGKEGKTLLMKSVFKLGGKTPLTKRVFQLGGKKITLYGN
jgi:hypothetical protein